jgi:hypothetical protein
MEPYLLSLGLIGLTIGDHNFEKLIGRCLMHGKEQLLGLILD